jgi:hypothetical protein
MLTGASKLLKAHRNGYLGQLAANYQHDQSGLQIIFAGQICSRIDPAIVGCYAARVTIRFLLISFFI